MTIPYRVHDSEFTSLKIKTLKYRLQYHIVIMMFCADWPHMWSGSTGPIHSYCDVHFPLSAIPFFSRVSYLVGYNLCSPRQWQIIKDKQSLQSTLVADNYGQVEWDILWCSVYIYNSNVCGPDWYICFVLFFVFFIFFSSTYFISQYI
jgi:hypothetical protein